MYQNQFKAALQARQPQIGLWMSLANPYTAELCATAGFDWLLIDGEHGPNDVRSMLLQLQAVAAYPGHAVVRAVSDDVALVKQLLDIGAQTLLIPMVDDAAQARRMVAATRYPPEGRRGVGSYVARVSRWGGRTDYLAHANEEVCLLVQAETRTALGNLESICAVDGVDGVFIGPADLAASLGHRGEPGHPAVLAAIDDAIRRIVASGKAAGILHTDQALVRHYLALGCTFVAVGLDVSVLAAGVRGLRRDYADIGPRP